MEKHFLASKTIWLNGQAAQAAQAQASYLTKSRPAMPPFA